MESISGSSSNPQCMLFPWTDGSPKVPGCAEPVSQRYAGEREQGGGEGVGREDRGR